MSYGKEITFGKHKGKTIEQIHFIDYGWLSWAMRQSNMSWIRRYIENLPEIYPNKIKVKCGENHHAGCKDKRATQVSLPIDHHGCVVAHPNVAYYWCLECDIYSAGAVGY